MVGEDCQEHICSNTKEIPKIVMGNVTFAESRLPGSTSPLNAVELGRATWPILHRMTLSYPKNPTDVQKDSMRRFINAFSWLYPCKVCATDFRDKIVELEPKLDSRQDLSIWMCQQHNLVNEKLGKKKFNCSIRALEILYGRESRRSQLLAE